MGTVTVCVFDRQTDRKAFNRLACVEGNREMDDKEAKVLQSRHCTNDLLSNDVLQSRCHLNKLHLDCNIWRYCRYFAVTEKYKILQILQNVIFNFDLFVMFVLYNY